ncbi:transposase [bacterium (Candidatus Blackallbacteria) CG18_big_fil_WC_8_21_14_2_50_49_26]|nr:MAG: transposase [bacterium (Candidatus Blackallbacteria) CG18_big_fil_WC_8_21_14_2_50_49_26]
MQDVVERVGKAFQGFFSRLKRIGVKAGFPRFRSRARYNSFTLKQAGWKLEGRHLKIKGIGIFKLFLSREIQGRIKTVTVRRDACGDWWVCFSCDEVPSRVYPEPQFEGVGLDVGLNAFCTDTEGMQIANQKYYRKAQADLRRRQRKVARRKKGSHRRKKALKELARVHRQIKNMRLDFLHKTANYYINKFKTLCVEKLNIRNMVKNKYLSKSISDASWGTFVELLLCKAAEAGREVIQVDPKGTSQNCSSCGEPVKKSLAVRIHRCPHCGLEMDRDENAARNIAAKANIKIGVGLTPQALT